jgi:hypothetical protein
MVIIIIVCIHGKRGRGYVGIMVGIIMVESVLVIILIIAIIVISESWKFAARKSTATPVRCIELLESNVAIPLAVVEPWDGGILVYNRVFNDSELRGRYTTTSAEHDRLPVGYRATFLAGITVACPVLEKRNGRIFRKGVFPFFFFPSIEEILRVSQV